MSSSCLQCTLSAPFALEGIGLHTGQGVRVIVEPAEENAGILLQRADLPGSTPFPAHWRSVLQASALNTTLGQADQSICTVEHLLSALRGWGIDNALIKVHGPEVPILDGSALPFLEGLRKAGRVEQQTARKIGQLSRPIFLAQGEVTLVAIPADELRLSYTLHYPGHPLLQAQFHSQIIDEEQYAAACAPCRTFTLVQEIEWLRARGLIQGGSLENAVVVDGDRVLNPEGLRFSNEMARHKVLDLLGDLSLAGGFFHAHVIAIRSGHATHVAFARELSSALMWA
jgi:UDP-3-O-[3-hydroxymyristoyl] N-acetylglucosamine deacetylase